MTKPEVVGPEVAEPEVAGGPDTGPEVGCDGVEKRRKWVELNRKSA